mgnify:CR=1 FL=1
MTTSAFSTTDDTLLGTLRGELGQWDFLKGLLTMFNLVTLVDEDNPDNIIIEPYSDVFIPTATAGNTLANRGIQHDWTDKIDVSEMKLTPLTDLNSKTIPAQNGVVGSAAETDFLQFSHLSDVPTIPSTPTVAGSLDFHFGECQLMPSVGLPVLNNLFNLYWLPYYLELYNPNTRIMTIKVNLSPSDINTFKFNDTVYLKNRVFRVNKIDYKPNDLATVEFILTP